jgi:D-alanyl-D-alanine carboxypeptidase/D-alanyl-D-alanine-endopeptidase (penicillin-binding protein 4)
LRSVYLPRILVPPWFTGWDVPLALPPEERWIALRGKILLLTAMAFAVAMTVLCGCQADTQRGSRSSETPTKGQKDEGKGGTQGGEAQAELGPKVEKIMNHPFYRYGEWGYLEVDPANGHTVRSLGPAERLYIPGSSTKLFSVSAALDDLGFDHRFKTPVYAQGKVKNGTLRGNLVLVASGDLTMGGRTTPKGTVAYTPVDHTYANDVPGATLTPENPLAGLDEIARQVRKSGIRRVDGNVVIDDRLFDPPPADDPDPNLDPWPSPITINDNVIDVEVTPGKVGEAPKVVKWRPQVSPYHLDVQAKTVPAGKPTTLSVNTESQGRIVVSGDLAADSGKQLRVASVDDPASFARTALIEALKRAGLSVGASPTGSNPSSGLPKMGSYKADDRVAAYVSPPYSQYAELILKVSHNYGANLNVCLMAVKAGSADCNDAFPVMKKFFENAGVHVEQVALADGRGGNPTDRFTPKAATDLLLYWLEQPQAKTFREMLPELGVNGSLAKDCKDCPARGKVFAKTGTVALPDFVNGRLIEAESLGGYLEAEPGRYHVFYLVVNGASVQNIEEALQVFNDLSEIAAILQEDASHQGGGSHSDQH